MNLWIVLLRAATEFRRDAATCWYSLPEFRKLYLEKENELSEKLYAEQAFHLRRSAHGH